MAHGIEIDEQIDNDEAVSNSAGAVTVEDTHQRLIQIELLDVTDRINQSVHTKEWLLHNKDAEILSLTGDLFAVESTLTKKGKVFVKSAPLPHVRATDGPIIDLTVKPRRKEGGFSYTLHQTGPEDLESWIVLDFEGGPVGMTKSLHRWQQSLRPQNEQHRVPKFLSNSWGDRNQDSRIQEAFMLKEIDRGAKLGVDVVQIDDGWQKGRSANSAEAQEKGGVRAGFWDADPDFWTPDPERFLYGLKPLLERASAHGNGLIATISEPFGYLFARTINERTTNE